MRECLSHGLTLAIGAKHIGTRLTKSNPQSHCTRVAVRLHTLVFPINTAFNHGIFSSEHCTKEAIIGWISRITANCKAVVCMYYGVNRLHTGCSLYKPPYAPLTYDLSNSNISILIRRKARVSGTQRRETLPHRFGK